MTTSTSIPVTGATTNIGRDCPLPPAHFFTTFLHEHRGAWA